jgi:alkanesulfonate monooxygenase SsuD/methylene tetrahydromethanopterin reductase-like flavin-dependent oxidoreductase (luciferase family)
MSGSSPEAGAYAAENHIGIGFAFTNLPRAMIAADFYREHARKHGWDPTPDDIIYRVAIHLADTDAEAREDIEAAGAGRTRVGVSTANVHLEAAVAKSGFYGIDVDGQRGRLMDRSELDQRIENGQILIGSPDTVLKQIKRIRDELGAGILDLTLIVQSGDKPQRTIELLGEKVLPEIRGF